jgi:hypothetical protein
MVMLVVHLLAAKEFAADTPSEVSISGVELAR